MSACIAHNDGRDGLFFLSLIRLIRAVVGRSRDECLPLNHLALSVQSGGIFRTKIYSGNILSSHVIRTVFSLGSNEASLLRHDITLVPVVSFALLSMLQLTCVVLSSPADCLSSSLHPRKTLTSGRPRPRRDSQEFLNRFDRDSAPVYMGAVSQERFPPAATRDAVKPTYP